MPRTKYAKSIEEDEELESSVDVVEEVKTKPVQKRKFASDDPIVCRSVAVGGVAMPGVKSNELYRWTEYGDYTEVEYADLASYVRSKSDYIFRPYIIIEDEDFINEFPLLKKFYEESYTVKDLEGILNLPVSSMIATINTLPNGAKETLKNIASTQIVNGRLDSVKKIRALDEVFGTELNLFASLFE